MQALHRYRAYVSYWLDAVDEHSLHSPFLYELMTRVIKAAPVHDERLEALRRELLRDRNEIVVNDLGTGAKLHPDKRRISAIARKSLSPPRYSSLYQRLIGHFRCRTIVELGTSLGINTLYLAQPDDTQVYTFEGAPAIAAIAKTNFMRMGKTNITLREGDIDTTLTDFIKEGRAIDFAFMDANHTRDATTRYFTELLRALHEDSIVVLDDIHLTREMEEAWGDLRRHERVRATADLYRCGIAFFKPSLDKQHVVLKA